MLTSACRSTDQLLGAYVDRELAGTARLRVSRHLAVCAACAREAQGLASVGDLLRAAVAEEGPPLRQEGLAPGVVARVRAESALSWTAGLERAVGDSRWLWVGTGSVLGALASTLLVAFAMFFGQGPARSDSLASVLGRLNSPGTLFVVVQSESGGQGGFLVQVNPSGTGSGNRLITEAMLVGPSAVQLVDALAHAVTRQGQIVELSEMGARDREDTEALLNEFKRRQSKELVRVAVQQVRLVASTEVSAKGL